MGKMKIIPIFVPHLGCPHTCSFCNQRYITAQKEPMTPAAAEKIIDMYLSTMNPDKHHIEIAFFGGSFTAIPLEEQNMLLSVAKKYVDSGFVHSIRISTRPDYIDNKILENLLSYKVEVVELGVQNMSNSVLLANERGHTAEDVSRACQLISNFNMTLGVQQMPGLYTATEEDDINTALELVKLKPRIVRIYPTLVFRNTKLAQLYDSGKYAPLSVENAVKICKKLHNIYSENHVKVIRTGLLVNHTDARENLIDGPYHPRFGDLCKE